MEDILSNLPIEPKPEIPRDAHIRELIKEFSPTCREIVIVGPPLSGKTNLLSQFVRLNPDRTIKYFIGSDPWTQTQYSFLYSICFQMCQLLDKPFPSEQSQNDELKSQIVALSLQLQRRAKGELKPFYFVIDGLENAFAGPTGSRIIDLFPLQTYSESPYLIFSMLEDKADDLPVDTKRQRLLSRPRYFNFQDTKTFLTSLHLPEQEISLIHNRYEGIPGYINLFREIKSQTPDIPIQSIHSDLEGLISQQIEAVFSIAEEETIRVLELLASSSALLPIDIIAKVLGVESYKVKSIAEKSSLLVVKGERLAYATEFARRIVRKRVEQQINTLIMELIAKVESTNPVDGFLLNILLKESKDYEGLCSRLTSTQIMSTIEHTGDLSLIIQRISYASDIAHDAHNVDGTYKWTLANATMKEFASNIIDEAEIDALSSIGESNEALNRAFALPDEISKIRALARTYLIMEGNGEVVSKSAKEMLLEMAKNYDRLNTDQDILRELAIDLFPLFPDFSVKLLEGVAMQTARRGIIEVALGNIMDAQEERDKDEFSTDDKEQLIATEFQEVIIHWLQDSSLQEIESLVEDIESANAKEYLVRMWCQQHKGTVESAHGIRIWLDIIIGDKTFVVPMRSLRHISEVLVEVPLNDRNELINRLLIPSLLSLTSPKEEWVQFQINIARAKFQLEPGIARTLLLALYEQVKQDAMDLDTRSLCYACIWAAMAQIMPNEKALLKDIETAFETTYDLLLNNSANHFELIRDVMAALVDVDPFAALVKALDLNMEDRRYKAIKTILIQLLRTKGDKDVSEPLVIGLNELNSEEQGDLIAEVLERLNSQNIGLHENNIGILEAYAVKIEYPYVKALAFLNLSKLTVHDQTIRSRMMLVVAECWQQEPDLSIRFKLGYRIIKEFSALDIDLARDFYSKLSKLQQQPDAPLAMKDFGRFFIHLLDLTMRALSSQNFQGEMLEVKTIVKTIKMIPSKRIQCYLIANLASVAYRNDYNAVADNLINSELLKILNSIEVLTDKRLAIAYGLPIIQKYDMDVAVDLSKHLSPRQKDAAWVSSITWILSNSYLYDRSVDVRHLRIPLYLPKIKMTINLLKKITNDTLIHYALVGICSAIEVSVESHIDLLQALDVLQQLEKIVEDKLPDINNIKHDGYLIISLSTIHRTRSILYHEAKRKRGLSPVAIRNKWTDIRVRAESVPNIADRVLVMVKVAEDMYSYFSDRRESRLLLDKAEAQVLEIPTVTDRIDRLIMIGETWGKLSERSEAQTILEMAVEQNKKLEGLNAEQRLDSIIQTAYKISPDFAETMVARLDSRSEQPFVNLATERMFVEQLIQDPSKIDQVMNNSTAGKDNILGLSASRLLTDLITGRGNVPTNEVISKWLRYTQRYYSEACRVVFDWVLESYTKRTAITSKIVSSETVLEVADMAYRLSYLAASSKKEILARSPQEILPGLDTQRKIFSTGEAESALAWIQEWLKENVGSYLKLCDPYFGKSELEYLRYVPTETKVLVVTTDHFFKEDLEDIRKDMESRWVNMTSATMPIITIFIVPKSHEETFHDRVMVTNKAGLLLGQSLNGLGRKKGIITLLSEEEAKDIEIRYINDMVNTSHWFLQHDIQPALLVIGRK